MTYKVIVVGSGLSGKSSLVDRLLDRSYSDVYIPTGGVRLEKLRIDNSTYNIWDCAGSERYKGLYEAYYLGADIAIVVFNSDKFSVTEDIDNNIKTVKRLCGDIPIIVCGSRVDIADMNDLLSSKKFTEYFTLHDIIFFSSKNNTCITTIKKEIVRGCAREKVRLNKIDEIHEKEVIKKFDELDHRTFESDRPESKVNDEVKSVDSSPCRNYCIIM